MAYRQVVEFGMSPTIGHISLPHKKPSEPAKRMYSDKLARMIDQVVCILLLLFDTLYRMMQNGLTKVVTHNILQMGTEHRLPLMHATMEYCLPLKIGRGWSITMIIILCRIFRKFKFGCDKSVCTMYL